MGFPTVSNLCQIHSSGYLPVNELLCENHALYDGVILVFFWQTQTRTIMRKSGREARYRILALQADRVEIMEYI